ncbi:MAG TPA: twin-arginine translocase subunit TatC [bacterium]|nr:twin-arginine translocase subunit TatC [bacterium]
MSPEALDKQSLVQHLTELRKRLIYASASLLAGMLACLYFSKDIFRFLQKPLLSVLPPGSAFIATSPLEALVTYLQVALLAGTFLSSPVVLYQFWSFVAPALYKKEKSLAVGFVSFATFFFVGGALFGYYGIFPVGFKFFVSALEGTGIQFLPQMKDYLSFISRMLLTFGFIFEMPLVIVLLARVGIVRREMLSKARRYVLVAVFLVAGVLTPGPDVLSQFLLAVPLLILYELSVLAVRLMEGRKPA